MTLESFFRRMLKALLTKEKKRLHPSGGSFAFDEASMTIRTTEESTFGFGKKAPGGTRNSTLGDAKNWQNIERNPLVFPCGAAPIRYRTRQRMIPALHSGAACTSMRSPLARAGSNSTTLYASFATPWMDGDLGSSWLSPEASPYWAMAAQCAYLAGERGIAWSYLTKSAICGSAKSYESLKVDAGRWVAGSASTQPTTQMVEPAARRAALLRAIALYVEVNAHPRALSLVDRYAGEIDGAAELRKDIVQKWDRILDELLNDAERIVLFGREVHRGVGDPGKAIPWAFPDPSRPVTSMGD
jgi:hypothetical protein